MFPIRDTIKHHSFPIINWLIILANLAVFAYELSLPETELEAFFHHYALVPERVTSMNWGVNNGLMGLNILSFVTNTFLHAGWGHILGNMWTLFIFGDNVEDRLGHGRYLLFYLLVGIIASFTHFMVFPTSGVPALGASGAISGVMAAYMFMFPKSRIVFLFPIFIIPFFFKIPAVLYIFVWFVIQLFSGTQSLSVEDDVTGIAFWAHIGGFVAGALLLFLVFKPKREL